jgi:hypothetical protein
MHPVDKVHVGMARGTEHDPVAGGDPEPGVRGPVVDPDVRLEFDDPPDASTGGVVTDQPGAQERATGLQAGTTQDGPVDDPRDVQRKG